MARYKQNKLGRGISISLVACVLLALACTSRPVFAEDQSYKEDQIKAIFIYNFARFVRWPKKAFVHESSAFNFCVAGKNQVSEILRKVVEGESLAGREFKVRSITTADQLEGCHIFYLPDYVEWHYSEIMESNSTFGILTVSDAEGFASAGGMIALSNHNGRIRLVINTRKLSSAKLNASAKLLGLATIVGSD